MVASKPFLATALIALVSTAAALGDNPTFKPRSADQAMAVGALLRQSDFGAGWRGGPTKPNPIGNPKCPGFDPKESDLVVTGHADARFTFEQAGVELDQDVQVLASPDFVRQDFARTISPQLGQCLAFQIRKASNVDAVTVTRIPFPPTGIVSAAYRAEITVRTKNGPRKVLSDFVFFGIGRVEYSVNVTAPMGAGDQLGRFESSIADLLLKRMGVGPA